MYVLLVMLDCCFWESPMGVLREEDIKIECLKRFIESSREWINDVVFKTKSFQKFQNGRRPSFNL